MTSDVGSAAGRRTTIALEVERGDGALASAELLLAAGMLPDAVSRAYYAAFHHARAMLLTLGEEPASHAGVERLLHRDLVRPGTLSPEIGRLFGRLQKTRHEADYTSEVVFTREAATDEVAAARRFVAASREILARTGWLPQA